MKALLSRQPGGPETLTLEDVADPVPGRGEVRIGVRAVGVNFPDLLIIQDLYQIKPPRPFSPGGELAGVVETLGEGVTTLKVGDRVLVSPVRGAMAEKAVAPAGNCWKIPDAMHFDEAAALLMTYGTSQHALKDRANLRVGETLLVLGAGGGVGLAALFDHAHRQMRCACHRFCKRTFFTEWSGAFSRYPRARRVTAP